AGPSAPTELVLVPMLFILPLGQVPLWVALALVLAGAPELAKTWSLERALGPLRHSWHAIGPVLVLAVAGEHPPVWRYSPFYLAALCAQFAFDTVSRARSDRRARGVQLLPPSLRWAFLVDATLAPIGLAIAFAAGAGPATVLLELPLIALLAV